MKKTIIGCLMNFEKGGDCFSDFDWYAIRENYFKAIQNAGGAGIALPYDMDSISEYMSIIDGLVIIGGWDYSPSYYGEDTKNPDLYSGKDKKIRTMPEREQFDFAILKAALEFDKSILGICAGEQLINIYFGGTLIQHIPDEIPNALEHLRPVPASQIAHDINVVSGTLLHKCVGVKSFGVNSAHHQAVGKPGKGIVVNAHAPDGVIEGVEYPDHKFCLGVEWHPEFELSEHDRNIMKAFVASAK